MTLTQDELFSIFKSEHFLRAYNAASEIDEENPNKLFWKLYGYGFT